MPLLSFNGIPVIRATIRMPRVGVWNADMTVDTSTDVTGVGTLATSDKSFSLVGTVQRHGVFQNALSLRMVGGAGGFPTVLPPQAYRNVTIANVLGDILRTCGESLSGATATPTFLTAATPLPVDQALLSTPLATWVRIGTWTGRSAMQRLFDNRSTSWRMNPDGTVWVGTDSYPPPPPIAFDVLERYFGEGRIVIGCERPFLLPGTLLTISTSATQGVQKVSGVVHMITPDKIRAEVWFDRS